MGQYRTLVTLSIAVIIICVGGFAWFAFKSQPPPVLPIPVATGTDTPPPAPAATNVLDAPFDANTFAGLSPRAVNRRIPVIMYHDIIKKRGRNSVWFDCTKDEFTRQMDWLAEQGATPITLEQLHRHLTRGEDVPEKAVVLTFDDNYQGFYDNAYPILRERKFPSAMFVHTAFVGDKKGAHPKMTWETLTQLDKEGLVTIASHTLTHPDLPKVAPDQVDRELTESKAALELHLGHRVSYFAYPEGRYNASVEEAAHRAGYTMAFTVDNGPVEESPGILTLNRTIHTRLQKAWEECREAEVNAPASLVEIAHPATPSPIMLQVQQFDGIKLGIVRGGTAASRHAQGGFRKSVGEFVQEGGGQAGINGTFFANSELRGTDNQMIGPFLASSEGTFFADTAADRLPKLVNRPLVLWGPTKTVIVPFQIGSMNDAAGFRTLLPDVTDGFLAGAWIVHGGQPRTRDEMGAYSARDFNDPRRRAFLGVAENGDMILGGSLEVITTEQLARAAAAAGAQEAVLLDSGFSSSVVFDNKIVVTGHTAKNLPSRPVPHAIVLSGTLTPPTDPALVDLLAKADPAVGAVSAQEAQADLAPGAGGPGGDGRRGRGVRHRRHRS